MRPELLFLLAGALLAGACQSARPGTEGLAHVRRGDLVETLSDLGEVRSEEEFEIAAPLSTKIEGLVAEGTLVKPGDVVARLDARKQQDEVEAAELKLRQQAFDRQIKQAEGEAQIYRLEQERQKAELSWAQERTRLRLMAGGRDGALMVELKGTRAAVEEQLAILTHELPQRAALLAKGQLSRDEYDKARALAAELREQQQALRVRLTAAQRGPLREELGRQEAKVSLAQSGVARAQAELRSARDRLPVNLAVGDVELAKTRRELAENRAQVEACTVRAPQPGMFVYGKIWAGDDWARVKPGDAVSMGDTMARLSNPDKTLVRVSMNALDVPLVQVGQVASFSLDAFPGKHYRGQVLKIAAVGQKRYRRDRAEIRVFDVDLRALDHDRRIMPGMTAHVTIELRRWRDQLLMPLQAVHEDGGGAHVWRAGPRGPQRVPVRIVAANETEAAVAGDLAAGDRLLERGGQP